MAHDVFICYSTLNKTIADTVCTIPDQHGIRCWIAPRDVEPGDTWASTVIDAIGASRGLCADWVPMSTQQATHT